jgi:epoxyqueuosine reductase QueG
MTTDLPLAPTKPIDFGVWKFCETCKLCGRHCFAMWDQTPVSLETEPTYEITGPWNRVGVKKYQHDWSLCSCSEDSCGKVCPFNTKGDQYSVIHSIIKATIATTPVFNGFFANAETFFYGELGDDGPDGDVGRRTQKDFEAWWDRDLRRWPYDSELAGGNVTF